MKILVAVKRVIDPYVPVRVRADNLGVELKNVKMSINPFDEIAVEEALRWREKNVASEVVVVSIGHDACQETLRQALALGADRAIFVRTEDTLCSLSIAKILQKLVEQEQPKLVLMGKQSIDGDNNQTPQMLSALLNWPQATFASSISLTVDHIQVTREIDGGLETVACELPCVVSTDLRLNEPRYASLPNIMKAKQKPVIIMELHDLSVTLKPHTEILSVKAPATRQAGVIVDSVDVLIERLKKDGLM
jgi:electron transfer flavoprotein beta subunit